MERGFLIHSLPTSTEVARFRTLLTEYEGIIDKIDRNDGRISNGEKIQLQMISEAMREMIKNEELKKMFYLDLDNMKVKLHRISTHRY